MRKGDFFTGSYVLSLYEYKSHKETCIQQARKGEMFTGSYVLSLYEYKSHKETCIQQASRQEKIFTGSYVLSLYEYKSHKETCFVRFVFNTQADKRKKRQTGSEKGGNFHRVLCAFLV